MRCFIFITVFAMFLAGCGNRSGKGRPDAAPVLPADTISMVDLPGEEFDAPGQEDADSTAFVAPPPPLIINIVDWDPPTIHPRGGCPPPDPPRPDHHPHDGIDTLMIAEVPPMFGEGDLRVFREWVHENLEYPPLALVRGIEGRVIVTFVIGIDGRLAEPVILHSPDDMLSEETLRVLNLSPVWEPARQNGQKVASRINLPVMFRLPYPYNELGAADTVCVPVPDELSATGENEPSSKAGKRAARRAERQERRSRNR